VLDVCPCILHQVTATFHMTAKNMDVTRILTCYTKCGVIYVQKNDHMMAKVGVLRDSHYLFSTPYREFE
jgi:hypothetical protein